MITSSVAYLPQSMAVPIMKQGALPTEQSPYHAGCMRCYMPRS